MKVFLSWSGNTSKEVASALKTWLHYVFPRLNIWMSEQDIQAGTRWDQELGKALRECKVGIVCVTPDSMSSRWLAFESGALSAAVGGTSDSLSVSASFVRHKSPAFSIPGRGC